MPNRRLLLPLLVTLATIGAVVSLAFLIGPTGTARLGPAAAASPAPVVSPSPPAPVASPPPPAPAAAVRATYAANPQRCTGYVALTFDDGPSELTPALLQALRQSLAAAVFFNVGRNVEKFPGYVVQEVHEGHQLGSHSYAHPDLTTIPDAAVAADIARATRVMSTLGPVTFFRPPFGSYDAAVVAELGRQRLELAMWTVDSKDYEHDDPDEVVARATRAGPGGIVLLHDGHQQTVDALPRIIDAYRARGLCTGLLARSDRVQEPEDWPGRTFHVTAVAADDAQ